MKKTNQKIILVVCRGNIIRSPFAESIINRQLKLKGLGKIFLAISRGVQGTVVDPIPVKYPNITYYKKEYKNCKNIFEKFGIDVTNHVSKPINRKIAEKSQIVLVVDESIKKALLTLYPNLAHKIFKLSQLTNRNKNFADLENIDGQNIYQKVLGEIYKTITKGFPKLMALANRKEKLKIK